MIKRRNASGKIRVNIVRKLGLIVYGVCRVNQCSVPWYNATSSSSSSSSCMWTARGVSVFYIFQSTIATMYYYY